MKYYSEVTQKMYDTVEELNEAELKANIAEDEKQKAYAEYRDAVKAYGEAYNNAHEIVNKARKVLREKEEAYNKLRFKSDPQESDDSDGSWDDLVSLLGMIFNDK